MTQAKEPQDNIELKKEFYLRHMENLNSTGTMGVKEYNYRVMAMWEFLLPHLKDDNKIRREAVEGFIKETILAIDIMPDDNIRLLLEPIEIFMKHALEEYLKKEVRNGNV